MCWLQSRLHLSHHKYRSAWIGYGAGPVQPKWNDAFLWDVGVPKSECRNGSAGQFERDWSYGTATVDCNTYTATVPCNPTDRKCGMVPPPPPGPHPRPPPPPGPGPTPMPVPGSGWSNSHNCTSCQGKGGVAQPLVPSKAGLSFGQCQALCVANPACHYINYVLPESSASHCTIWGHCDELCLTDHCYHWWVTYEYFARPSTVRWNQTACDSLPEGPDHQPPSPPPPPSPAPPPPSPPPPAPPSPAPVPPPLPPPAPHGARNILMIVVDDLRPELGCFNQSQVVTPNIDKFASQGTLFSRAYVQYSICAPSRNSFMCVSLAL